MKVCNKFWPPTGGSQSPPPRNGSLKKSGEREKLKYFDNWVGASISSSEVSF